MKPAVIAVRAKRRARIGAGEPAAGEPLAGPVRQILPPLPRLPRPAPGGPDLCRVRLLRHGGRLCRDQAAALLMLGASGALA